MTKRAKLTLVVPFIGLAGACGGGGDPEPPPPPPAMGADVAVTVTAPATATPGAAIEYRVTVSNDGTAAASNVGLALQLPGGFMPDAVSDGGLVSADAVEWEALPSLASGDEAIFTVAGPAPLVGPLLAEATATLDADSATVNNTAAARTVLTFEALGPVLTGEANGDFFGVVADYIGDIDGDGAGDFIIGAKFADGGGDDAGALYVYSGAAVAGGSAEALFTHYGAAANGELGQAVAAVGDVDGDGVPDYGGGSPQAGSGSVVLYSGADGTSIRTVDGENTGDRFGFALAEAGGDIDGDGVSDFVVGAIGADGNAGRVYAVSGADGTFIRSHASPGGSEFGIGVGGFGDIDGDGRADYAGGITNPAPGEVVVWSGADGSELYRFSDTAAGAVFLGAFWIDTPGDIDGDAVPDIFFSDIQRSDNGGNRGRVYLLSGATGETIFTVDGEMPQDVFGIGRNSGFDDNNDGVPDIFAAGYRNAEGGMQTGKGYVVSGADGSILRTIAGTTPGQTLGYDAVQLGDVDGDGLGDYLLTGDIENNLAGSGVIVRGVAF